MESLKDLNALTTRDKGNASRDLEWVKFGDVTGSLSFWVVYDQLVYLLPHSLIKDISEFSCREFHKY